MIDFDGFHSEFNLGSAGGWEFQRIAQLIEKKTWQTLKKMSPVIKKLSPVLDFDHRYFYPVFGFIDLLVKAHKRHSGRSKGLIAVVAEAESLEDVGENRTLVELIKKISGIDAVLMAPHELELKNNRVYYRKRRVSVAFVDFNTDVFVKLYNKDFGLKGLLQLIGEDRVINPRGLETINGKEWFEILTDWDYRTRFPFEVVARTPWTRKFYPRSTIGPRGEKISDLVEWTRQNWGWIVLKPTRGYSGQGVIIGNGTGNRTSVDEKTEQALKKEYIVQEKIPLALWSEELPELNVDGSLVHQTDLRCFFSEHGLMGFLGRYGSVPTNVGSGGGVWHFALLKDGLDLRDTVNRINDAIMSLPTRDYLELAGEQKAMANEMEFRYLLGPIKTSLRPRLITTQQIIAFERYARALWQTCLTLNQLAQGELKNFTKKTAAIKFADENPWSGVPPLLAADGMFNLGAHV